MDGSDVFSGDPKSIRGTRPIVLPSCPITLIDPVTERRKALNESLAANGLLTDAVSRLSRPSAATLVLLHIGSTLLDDAETAARIAEARKHLAPGTAIAVIADRDDPELALRALREGLCGYVPGSLPVNMMIAAILLMMAGGLFLSPESLTRHVGARDVVLKAPVRPPVNLTTREDEVLLALQQGKPNKIIAADLKIAESTVKIHVRNIMKKLRASNRTQIVVLSRGPGEKTAAPA